jgi:diguanylate cyclase (GGDEF)-like protein
MPHATTRPALARLRGLLIGCCCVWCCGAALAGAPNSLRFDQLDMEQGLSQDAVYAIAQDGAGFIWLGNQSGLNRYDGYRVTVFKNDPADPASLSDNWVDALYTDPHGVLWVGTLGGLNRYDPAHAGFVRYPLPDSERGRSPAHDIRAICGDGAGGLWLATHDGLQHLDVASGRYRIWRHDVARPDSLGADRVRALARDAAGNLWIGTAAGVDRMALGAGGFEHFRLDDPQAPEARAAAHPNPVFALQLDRQGTLWVGTHAGVEAWTTDGAGLHRRRFGAAEGLQPGTVLAILIDADGQLWVGQESGGLSRWDPASARFVAYRHHAVDAHSLADDDVGALFQDRSGTLWAGTWYGGASRTDLFSGGFDKIAHLPDDAPGDGAGTSAGAAPANPSAPISLGDSHVSSVAGGAAGVLWLGTVSGLDRLDLGARAVRIYRHSGKDPGSLSSDRISSVLPGRDGRLWVGTEAGLDDFDPATGRAIAYHLGNGGLYDDAVASMAAEPAGKLWIGSVRGLYGFDPLSHAVQTFRNDPQNPGSLSAGNINAVLCDRSGAVWAGTDNGLDRHDQAGGDFVHFRHDPNDPASLSLNVVSSLFQDHAGTLWVGTASGGLNRLQYGADGAVRFGHFTTRDGLGSDTIDAIAEDTGGRLWVSTDAGISRFDAATGRFKSYTARDGTLDGEYFSQSAFRDAAGILYFGGGTGLTLFNPEAIRDNPVAPDVVMTDMQIFNRPLLASAPPPGVKLDAPIALARAVTLPYRDSVFSLEFAALHFANPQRNRYAYRLDGFDRDWNQADAGKRFATYTNLDPGHYVFRVKAANKDGKWNDAGARLDIVITPPFWMTWWFRCALAAALLGSLLLAYRRRIAALKHQHEVLEQQVATRTAEVVQQKEMVERQKALVEKQHQELERAHNALDELSVSDPLTGLRNRRFLTRHIEADAALSQRSYETWLRESDKAPPHNADLVFFMVDIDHFKLVNDVHGHAAGDQVLVQMRARLELVFRESDYIVRWGGEEFLVVARSANRGEAGVMAERIRAAVADTPFELEGGTPLAKTCSVGFACFPFVPTQPRLLPWLQMVSLADQGLYTAKFGGRNAWVGWSWSARRHGATADEAARWLLSPSDAVLAGDLDCASSLPPESLHMAWRRQKERMEQAGGR